VTLRTFSDGDGRIWQVWDTIPQTPAEHRRFAQNADPRRGPNNTAQAGGTAEDPVASADPSEGDGMGSAALSPNLGVSSGMADGWLTFATDGEKRRLVPIPIDWYEADDATLSTYCRSARPVGTRKPE